MIIEIKIRKHLMSDNIEIEILIIASIVPMVEVYVFVQNVLLQHQFVQYRTFLLRI